MKNIDNQLRLKSVCETPCQNSYFTVVYIMFAGDESSMQDCFGFEAEEES